MDLLQQLDLPSDSSDTEDFLQELAALNDVGLLRATMESLECGRLTPLIKEELRCRIQSRRLSEGKEELLVEFPSPTPSQPRPDEVEKRDRRREQNRRAAQKFRKKKKERGEHLIEETQRLECHNTSLRSEIKQLHEEREQLTRIIQNHASVCPLTPRQSPLTIPRESPLPGSIRESPLPMSIPSAAANILAKSPVMGKSRVLVQSPALLVPPTRESPVPLLIINPTGESPVPNSIVPSSPVPMTGRPRKSPVSLLRLNQSPVPGDKLGDKSPIPFGSPPKQSKHSIPPRLNLAGPKPVIPILPKPASGVPQSSPSPKTPKAIITSPLPIVPSPVSVGGRALHVSPVFFSESCFTPSGRGRQVNQSPISISDSSTSSTPGRITQQSPVFFGERAPSSAQANSQFLQPLSASSVSSTSSLASLLRQESPLSVLSNSSGISNASSVFIGNTNNSSTADSNANPSNNNNNNNNNSISSNNNNNNNIFPPSSNNVLEKPPSVYSCSPQSTSRENPDDNILSLEDIEKSATALEARDDLLDFIDIQALLELGGDHNGNPNCDVDTNQQGTSSTVHAMGGQMDNSMDTMGICQNNDNLITRTSCPETHLMGCTANNQCEMNNTQRPDQGLGISMLTQNVNTLSIPNVSHTMGTMGESSSSVGQNPNILLRHNSGHYESSFEVLRQNARVNQTDSPLQSYHHSQPGNTLTASTTIHHFHNQLGELISAQGSRMGMGECSTLRTLLGSDDSRLKDNENIQLNNTSTSLNSCFLRSGNDNSACSTDTSDSDLMQLHSSLSLDMLVTPQGVGISGSESAFSQTSHQYV